MFPKAEGIDLYTAIDRVVRAVGRIVVWVDAAAELSTISSSRWDSTLPNPEVPKTECPSDGQDVVLVVRVAQPDALGPEPGEGLGRKHHEQIGGQQDQRGEHRRRPGTVSGSAVSSLTDTVVSHPQ